MAQSDLSLLQAALIGFQAEKEKIEQAIADLRQRIGSAASMRGIGSAKTERRSRGGRRDLSPAARRRIAAAQKKRWAEYHKRKGTTTKAAKAAGTT
jgi:hypothetical protein